MKWLVSPLTHGFRFLYACSRVQRVPLVLLRVTALCPVTLGAQGCHLPGAVSVRLCQMCLVTQNSLKQEGSSGFGRDLPQAPPPAVPCWLGGSWQPQDRHPTGSWKPPRRKESRIKEKFEITPSRLSVGPHSVPQFPFPQRKPRVQEQWGLPWRGSLEVGAPQCAWPQDWCSAPFVPRLLHSRGFRHSCP